MVSCRCRSSLWRSHGEGDRSLKASGGGAATSRHSPSVSPMGCHLPMASPQGGLRPLPVETCRPQISASIASASLASRSDNPSARSEEHTSELQSLMRISYAGFCLNTKINKREYPNQHTYQEKQQNNTMHKP